MNRILVLLVLLIVFSPLFAIAGDKGPAPNLNYSLMKTKAMIDARDFLRNGGVEQMQAVSVDLPDESRMALYDEYRNNGARGFFSLLVPSLGNWLVGDKLGGTISVVGFSGGYIGWLFTKKPYDLIGVAIMLAAYIYSPVSAFCYSGGYNEKLKSSLNIASIDPAEMGRKAMAEAVNMPKTSPELFHFGLLSYSF